MESLVSDWLWLSILELVWLPIATAYVILQRRSASATIAWALALAFFPLFGLLLYFFFGPRRYDKRKRRRALAQRSVSESTVLARADPAGENLSPAAEHLVRLAERAVGPAGVPRLGNMTVFSSGEALFRELLRAIEQAEQHIHLEYYIWEPDRLGTRLRDALLIKRKEGVEVRVLVDGFGSSKAHDLFWDPLSRAGGQVCRFNALTFTSWRPRMANFRTHRKIAVIDGWVGFTGGMNVTEVQSEEFAGEKAWRDTHARIEGDAVVALQQVFFEDWHYASGESPQLPEYLATGERSDPNNGALLQVVSSGPDENLDAIHKLFVASVAAARRTVFLTTAYFVPDEALMQALASAALAGVEVRILIPVAGDVGVVAVAAKSYFPELLEVGVRIFTYQPRMLHAKTLVVDDTVALVGTANADNRSFRLNFEVLVAAYDAEVCRVLETLFNDDVRDASEVTLAMVRQTPFFERLKISAARLLSPIL